MANLGAVYSLRPSVRNSYDPVQGQLFRADQSALVGGGIPCVHSIRLFSRAHLRAR